MKKTIYITGIISLNVLMAGCLFKINHWPGGGILFTIGVLLVTIVALPLALIYHYRQSENKNSLLYWSIYICVFFDFIGALFKVMHWPGANKLLWIGIPIPFVLFFPIYLWHYSKLKVKNVNHFASIIFLLVYIAIYSVLLALGISGKLIKENLAFDDSVNRLNKQMVTMNTSKYSHINEVKTLGISLDTLQQFRKETKNIYNQIEKIKINLKKNAYYNFEHRSDEANKRMVYSLAESKNTINLLEGKHKQLLSLSLEIDSYISSSKSKFSLLSEFSGAIQYYHKYDENEKYHYIYEMPVLNFITYLNNLQTELLINESQVLNSYI